MRPENLSREAIARREIGSTEISRGLSVMLCTFFLLVLFVVPTYQLWLNYKAGVPAFSFDMQIPERQSPVSFVAKVNDNNKAILRNLDILETDLEERSFVRGLVLGPLQYLFLKLLGHGNEKVVVGRDGWLFYRPGVDYLIGPAFLDKQQLRMREESHEIWQKPVQPDPLKAIVDFNNQLAERNIALILLPVPIKPSIEPEKLSPRSFEAALYNRSWPAFLTALEKQGVAFVDIRPLLGNYARIHGSAFLATDTHWLPGAMEEVAALLGAMIRSRGIVQSGSNSLQLQGLQWQGEGDIARMLNLPENVQPFPGQTVELNQVKNSDGLFWQPSQESELLLLGDSFTNIYSTPGLGWGMAAGLAEQLSYHLRQPVDLLARNDDGAYVSREMLATELARGRDRLAGKKLLIWQFAERELSLGNWKIIDLRLGEPAESDFYVVPSGQRVEVTGTVAAISPSPLPGAVPYRDNIVTIHLVDLRGSEQLLAFDQLLVYGFGMRDNRLTPLASLRPGDAVTMELSAWDDVEADYGSYRRSPLDDEMMELELPNWGTIIDENTSKAK